MAMTNLKKGLGAAGGALMGGAGLIAAGLVSATGAGKYVAGGAAIGAAASKGANWLGSKSFNNTNTAGEQSLSPKSDPSEVEGGEVSILDKILRETDNLINVIKDRQIPPSTLREIQLDKDTQHKKLVAAFGSVKFDSGDKDKKSSWLGKIWDWIKGLLKALGRWLLWFKPFLGLLRTLWKFAARMLLVFASPAFIGIAAALLIMTNWKSIKKKAIKWINSIKSMLNKIPGINFEMTPMPEEPATTPAYQEGVTMDAGEFGETAVVETIASPTLAAFGGEGEPGIEPTGPEEFDVYEKLEVVPDEIIEEPADSEMIEATFDGTYYLGDDELQSMMSDKQIKDQWSTREIQTQTLMSRVIERGYAEDDEVNQLNALLRLGHGLDTYDVNKLSPTFYDAINEGNRGRMDRNLISAYSIKKDPRDELQEYLDKNSDTVVQQGTQPVGSVSTPATAPTVTPKPTKKRNLPLGMFAAVNEPAESTGIGWLDKLYAKDANMRYEKAFESQADKIKKVDKKVVYQTSNNNSMVSKQSTTVQHREKSGFNINNSSSVATVSAK